MPRTNEVTPYYIRNRNGESFYVDTLAEALEEFLADGGYRLTFNTPKRDLVLRRTSEWETVIIAGMKVENEKEATAGMVFRDKEKK